MTLGVIFVGDVMIDTKLVNLTVYVVRNKEGKFFRAKGYGGRGESWVDDVHKGRIYTALATARTIVTYYANAYPKYGVPDIVKLTVSKAEVLDEADRVAKKTEQKKKKKAERLVAEREWELRQAKDELERAKKAVEKFNKELSVNVSRP